jgi:HSP20 family protein
MNRHELLSYQNDIDRFFGNTNTKILAPVDLFESNEGYKIVMNIPGVEKNQIKIESDAESMEIRFELENEIKEEKKDEEGKVTYFLHERSNSYRSRIVNFSTFVHPSKTKLALENGVLTIEIPKAEGSKKISLNID